MPLIIEDGTGVPNANSYVNVADLRAFADARGISVPSNDAEGDTAIERALIAAMDYLQYVPCYQGAQTDSEQALEWPRTGVYFNGSLYNSAAIPKQLKEAENRLAIEVLNGTVLMPNVVAADYVTEETVGPITTKYADPTKVGIAPSFPMIDAVLAPLLCGQAAGFLNVYRV